MTDRNIVRCPHCHMNQFETGDKNCRRCHKTLFVPTVLPPVVNTYEQPRRMPPIDYSKVPETIEAYIKASGLTKAKLVSNGLGQRTVYEMKSAIRVGSIARFAEALNVPVFWFLEELTEDRLTEVFARQVVKETVNFNLAQRQVVLRNIQSICERTQMRRVG